mmetsp:Transcript_28734/g.67864  ORF Transcript_28734/g.67864 Transcript_28734/m.67864 type:complete len:213 (-) Transcript_28734:538-1176(-)
MSLCGNIQQTRLGERACLPTAISKKARWWSASARWCSCKPVIADLNALPAHRVRVFLEQCFSKLNFETRTLRKPLSDSCPLRRSFPPSQHLQYRAKGRAANFTAVNHAGIWRGNHTTSIFALVRRPKEGPSEIFWSMPTTTTTAFVQSVFYWQPCCLGFGVGAMWSRLGRHFLTSTADCGGSSLHCRQTSRRRMQKSFTRRSASSPPSHSTS